MPLHGDILEADHDGESIRVGIKRCCENLGIDYSTQLQKLKNKSWAVVGMSPTTGSDGKQYQMATINVEALPIWFATIDTRKVKPAIRAKIDLYQKEAARVLADHFLRRAEPSLEPVPFDFKWRSLSQLIPVGWPRDPWDCARAVE